MNKTKEKLSPVVLGAYSMGEVGCQLSWYMINNYLTLFYTDVVGLSASAISMIMLIARVWDAVNDPMMGNIADRTHTRWGKFRPYIFMAPPFLAIFNILTFTVFPVTGALKVLLCLVCYVGTGMAYTVVAVAYGALQNVITLDSQTRMNLATVRGLGSSIIGIILSAVAMPLILKFSGSDVANAKGYFWVTVILSIAMIPTLWFCAFFCKEKVHPVEAPQASGEKMGFLASLKVVAKNDQLLLVVLTTVLGTICVSGRMGILTYYIIYVNGDYTVISTVFTTMTVAQLIGIFILPLGTKFMNKKNYLILLNLVMAASFLLIYLNPHCNQVYLLVVSFIAGLCNSSSSICYGLVGDSIEYGAWKTGERQEGIAASMLGFGVKCSTAISGSASVLLLAAFGYVAGAEQTADAQQGINTVVNLIPFIIAVLSNVPLLFYKLTPKKVEEIRADLDAGKHAYDK